jgi:hypothetical protein
VSRTGVKCAQGVRQFAWSKYAPPCVAAFSGSNGGATSAGVTKDTITITVGFGNTAENSAIQSLAGPATPNDAAWANTIKDYAAYFDKQFETYGRHIVVKTYQMKSDYVQADMGQASAAAQADAQSAKSMGAFADMTALTNTSSEPYGNDLARLGVINWGFPLRAASNYQQLSPYIYNFLPDGTKWAKWAANLVCQKMDNLPAVYAGGSQKGQKRKFGIIEVNIPEVQAFGELAKQYASQECGVSMYTLHYSFDLSSFSQYGSSMMAQMQQSGITTILCPCDPLGPIFMTQAATQEGYYPEWVYYNEGIVDADYDAKQLTHSLSNGPALPPMNQTEALRIYQQIYPGKMPPSIPYFTWIYGIMLQFYNAVQMAGPDLTPATFHAAMASLPRSLPGGDYGPWWGSSSGVSTGEYTPWNAMQVTWWGAGAPRPDGAKGYWTPCQGNVFYSFDDLAAWGPKGQQVRCFGQ